MPNELYIPVDFVELSLAANLNAGATGEMVFAEDIGALEPKGWLVIRDPVNGDEVIEYTGKDAPNKKLTGLTRAIAGGDVTHDAGRAVFGATTAQYLRQLIERTHSFSSGDHQLSARLLNFKETTSLTIASGAITVARSAHTVDTEAGASSDELETINGGSGGDLLCLRIVSDARTVTLKHGVGNIRTPSGQDTLLDLTDKEVLLKFNGTNWLVMTEPSARVTVVSDLPPQYLYGLGLSNNSTDADHDLDIATGQARDDSNTFNISLDTALTKQLDAVFAEGNNDGGRDSADTLGADQEYHVFLLGDTTETKSTDVFFSTATSPTLPAGYDVKRRIGSIFTDAASNIHGFLQVGDYFRFQDPIVDISDSSGTAETWETATLTTPASSLAKISVFAESTSDSRTGVVLKTTGATDPTSSAGVTAQGSYYVDVVDRKRRINTQVEILVDENAQIEYTLVSGTDWALVEIMIFGYMDFRGKNA